MTSRSSPARRCVGLCIFSAAPARAQQFNSDNYLSKPHGMATIILTTGERNTMMMTTFSLLPRWEFTAAAYLFDADDDSRTGMATPRRSMPST